MAVVAPSVITSAAAGLCPDASVSIQTNTGYSQQHIVGSTGAQCLRIIDAGGLSTNGSHVFELQKISCILLGAALCTCTFCAGGLRACCLDCYAIAKALVGRQGCKPEDHSENFSLVLECYRKSEGVVLLRCSMVHLIRLLTGKAHESENAPEISSFCIFCLDVCMCTQLTKHLSLNVGLLLSCPSVCLCGT